MFDQRSIRPKVKFLSMDNETSNNLSHCVTGFQVQKHIRQPAGAFSLTLTPKVSEGSNYKSVNSLSYIYNKIFPMDLVSIGIEQEGGILVGLVDNVFKSKTVFGNNVREVINVRGRDFGKILVDDNTFHAPSVDKALITRLKSKLISEGIVNTAKGENVEEHPLARFFSENRAPKRFDAETGKFLGTTFYNATIEEAVKYILQCLSSLRVKINFEGDKNLSAHEFLLTQIKSRSGDVIATDSFNRYSGSLINFIYQIVDQEFYEVFVETITGQPVLVIRPKPFDRIGDKVTSKSGKLKTLSENDDHLWEKLTTLVGENQYHEIRKIEILKRDLGVSDYEVFSVYSNSSRSSLLGALHINQGQFWPMFDMFALKRYGLRTKFTQTHLLPIDVENDTIKNQEEVESRTRSYRDRQFNWNRYNAIFESGQVLCRGHDYYKLGDRIFLNDEIAKNGEKGILAYLAGYTQMWQFGQPYLTNLNLIRGENEKLIDDYKTKVVTEDSIVRSAG